MEARDAPPSHFRFKIESFSSLPSTSLIERYESCEFDAGDYRWKLALYPDGNKKRDIEGYISLYLVLADKSSVSLNKEILVTINLFVFDHVKDQYRKVSQQSRFHASKYECGFDKFLSLQTFKDPSNGYLMDDTCVFGAEVFVINNTTKGQCLSMMEVKPLPFKYTWKVEKFSTLEDICYYSDKFRIGDHDWKIAFFPKGHTTGSGNSISLFLRLVNEETLLATGGMVVVEYKLRIVDQVNANHCETAYTYCFTASKQSLGTPRFLNLSSLNKTTGYLLNDVCIVEADVTVLGSTKIWD